MNPPLRTSDQNYGYFITRVQRSASGGNIDHRIDMPARSEISVSARVPLRHGFPVLYMTAHKAASVTAAQVVILKDGFLPDHFQRIAAGQLRDDGTHQHMQIDVSRVGVSPKEKEPSYSQTVLPSWRRPA